MSEPKEFSVYLWFPDGSYWPEERWIDAETAVRAAKRLSESVGARIGTLSRIIITDGGDHIVFEWKHGLGVTFPRTNQRKRNEPTN